MPCSEGIGGGGRYGGLFNMTIIALKSFFFYFFFYHVSVSDFPSNLRLPNLHTLDPSIDLVHVTSTGQIYYFLHKHCFYTSSRRDASQDSRRRKRQKVVVVVFFSPVKMPRVVFFFPHLHH